ncbi:glutathione S-transferase [Phanerochaete sordida]|uniref:Glutathione S-transferase n=1 Tax=Phanerochaete sordida TaxID=48140 RepID=A0A9P3GCQ3_9APHY|nr:glutathione S-transferase [Phanerochaete sordida]
MAHHGITLFDIPSTTPQPWAPNIWKIRFILNYKRLPYRTTWVEFADVENTLRSIGAPPSSVRADGRPVYSLPVIVDPRGAQGQPVVLSRADVIAEYLESTYPARAIFPEGSRALQSLFVHHVHEVLAKPLLPILVPLSHQRLPERSQAHYPAGGAPPLGGAEREQAWRAAKDQFAFLAALMDKNIGDPTCDGIVAMGRSVTYADFALCSVLIWIEQVSPRDGWARVRSWNDGRWDRLRAKCREYMDVY